MHDMSRIVTTPEHAVPHDLARHELRVQAVTVGVADVALAVLQPGPGVVTPSVTRHVSRGKRHAAPVLAAVHRPVAEVGGAVALPLPVDPLAGVVHPGL